MKVFNNTILASYASVVIGMALLVAAFCMTISLYRKDYK